MSEDNAEADEVILCCCASCGITEVDDVKLKKCTACYLVRYCTIKCQREHRSKHKRACKKRAAELRDELLFKQPESTHLGDCPICMIPLHLDRNKSAMYPCCSKILCDGCNYANQMREFEAKMKSKCPFCREPIPETDIKIGEQRMKRIKMNDPDALKHQGIQQYKKGDYSGAFENYTKAAELGDADAHNNLSLLYSGKHVVAKDKGKEIYHLEEAAIAGHPVARYSLGHKEFSRGNAERAVKHFIIAATQGCDESIEVLMDLFKGGFVSNEDIAATLRAHQAAVDATKSPQRAAAEEFARRNNIK